MVTRDELKRLGLRAYERGRLWTAASVAWVVVPIVALCALETRAGEACICAGALLLAAALYLRWKDRRGAAAVSAGLLAGALPLAGGLLLRRLSLACEGAGLWSPCTAVCVAAGLTSGLWLGVRVARNRLGMTGALTAAGIASLAASVGCAGIGTTGVAGAVVGLVLGSAMSLLPARA